MSLSRIVGAAIATLALSVASGGAQEEEAKPKSAPGEKVEVKSETAGRRAISGVTATLKVQLVVSRYQGDKKTASLPYAFVVTAGSDRVRMRMGVSTPVPNFKNSVVDGKTKLVPAGFDYRDIGTNFDCIARDLGDGRYELNLTVENSSAMTAVDRPDDGGETGAPLFRRFETHVNPLLRDGQTIQTIASTDPVTGEVVKIDVTLNVLK